jgi:bacillolysin
MCSILSDASGYFSDGSGSANYANSALCQWILAPNGATQITVTFAEFNTQSLNDVVRLYHCADSSCQGVELITELSGFYSSSQTVRSGSGVILVQFKSDSNTSFPGFAATWTSNAPWAPLWLPIVCSPSICP